MIFITVGTQLPFDRLLEYFDEWRAGVGYTGKVVAQIGEGSHFGSPSIEVFKTLSSEQYYHWFCEADGIVSHAGMGSILSCLDHNKRGVFLPRQYALGEHRNDHQLDTAQAFAGKYPTLEFCADKVAFFSALNKLLDTRTPQVATVDKVSSNELGDKISTYLGIKGALL